MRKEWKKWTGAALAAVLTVGSLPGFVQAQEKGEEAKLPEAVLQVSFDEGNAKDLSGHGNDGMVIGTPEFVDGVSGKAVHIVNPDDIAGGSSDGEQYINFGTPEDLQFGTGDFSVAFWYKSDRSAATHKEGAIISNKDWGTGDNQGINFGDMNQGINLNYRAGGSGRKETDRYSEIMDGKWHFITGTFDRDGYMTLYVDGVLPTEGNGYQANAPQVSIADQQESVDYADFVIGADGNGKYSLQNGYIDELSVFREVLTQDQVKALNAQADPDEDTPKSGPVFEVSFDGEDAADSVAGNNGTIVGDVEFVDGVSGKAVHIQNPEDIAGANTKGEQYIDFGMPEELQFGSDDFTVMFWYQSDGTLPREGAVVSNKDWSTGGNPGFAIGDMVQGMTLNFCAQGSDGRIDTSRYGGATEDGVWHHIAAVFNRTGNMTLYVDGQAAASSSISSQAGKTIDVMNFVVGADGNYQCSVQDSYIDELKVYKRIVSEEEIADYCAPYVLQNKLDEYEVLIESSSASEEKKDAFRKAIEAVRAKAEGVTDPEEIQVLKDELKAAYNAFVGPDDGIMSFEVISDAHISGTDNNASPNKKLIDAMDDIKNDYTQKVSAVLNCGDYSNYGAESETQGYFNIISEYKSDFEIMTALGNHDVRWLSGGWPEVESRYLKYNSEYMGDIPEGQTYFDKWIDGYHFIVLNTQWDTKDRAYLSPEELSWFEKVMAEDAAPDKPIFVVLHQPLFDTYQNSNDWSEGVQDHQLKEILRKYPQTIMFMGHIHNGLGVIEVDRTDFGTMVDMPGMNSNDYGDGRGQLGYHVTVYDGKVRLDLRDYANDEWVSGYSYEIMMDPDTYPTGKLAELSFDDGTAADTAGNGNDGTIHGDVEFVEGIDGGKAVHITNKADETAEQYIEIDSGLTLGEDDFTVLFWYKAETVQEGTVFSNTADGENGICFDVTKDGGLGLTAAAGSVASTGRYDLSDGKWHAVTAVFDRDGLMTLYIDGAKKEEADISEWAGSALDGESFKLMIGAAADGTDGITDIYFDELSIYGNAMGQYEIGTIWTPYEITADQNSITVSWGELPEDTVPAYVLLNGERLMDVPDGEKSITITGLEPGTEYTVGMVNHENGKESNLRDVFGFAVTTKEEKTTTPVSTAVLEYALELAENVNTEGVVDSVVEIFNNTTAAAQDILDRAKAGDPSVTQEMVDVSWRDLITIMQFMEFKPGDMTDLQKVVDLAHSLDLTKYLDKGQQEFKDALAAAEAVLAEEFTEQTEIDQTWKTLLKAMSELRLKPSKEALEALITSAENISVEGADEETVSVFRSALARAVSVLDDAQATEAEVTSAEEELRAAIDSMLASAGESMGKTDGTAGGSTEKGGQQGSTASDKTASAGRSQNGVNAAGNLTAGAGTSVSSSKAVKTGDGFGFIIWAALLAAAGAVGGAAVKASGKRR